MRVIKAEKTSYWRQFEQGMLGREAVRVLTNLADSVMDTSDRSGGSLACACRCAVILIGQAAHLLAYVDVL